jgi:hypothetical protein
MSAATSDASARASARDQHLARSGDGIDADLAEDEPLGRRHVRVARADDLVDTRNRLRAVGQRGHRLGAADAIERIDRRPGGKRRG